MSDIEDAVIPTDNAQADSEQTPDEKPAKKNNNRLAKIIARVAAITAVAASQTQPVEASSKPSDHLTDDNHIAVVDDLETGSKQKTTEKSSRNETLSLPDSVSRWSHLITKVANDTGLDPQLIGSVIDYESDGDPDAIGNDGEVGLMQVMPYFVDVYCQGHNCSRFEDSNGNLDYADTTLTLLAGADMLKQEYDAAGGDISATLAGYNGGRTALLWFRGEKTQDEYIDHLIDSGYSEEQAENKATIVENYVDAVGNIYEAIQNK